jgi:hypothetical protein
MHIKPNKKHKMGGNIIVNHPNLYDHYKNSLPKQLRPNEF